MEGFVGRCQQTPEAGETSPGRNGRQEGAEQEQWGTLSPHPLRGTGDPALPSGKPWPEAGTRMAGRFLFLSFTGMAHPRFSSSPSCLCAFPAEGNYSCFVVLCFLIGQ
jgi:hypothetical protein